MRVSAEYKVSTKPTHIHVRVLICNTKLARNRKNYPQRAGFSGWVWVDLQVQLPSIILLRYFHVAYVFARSHDDLLLTNLLALIGLVKTSTRFSLVWIFCKSTHLSSITFETKVLNPYVLCFGLKCWIPCNVQGILTITKHMNFFLFVPKLLQ